MFTARAQAASTGLDHSPATPPTRCTGIGLVGLSVSHAWDTICHVPSFLMRSNISTPRSVHLPIVLGHFAGSKCDRNVAEHADLGAQHDLTERAQLCSRPALHPLDERRNGLARGRSGSGVERGLWKEVGRKGIPISRSSGRPYQAS